MNRSLQGFTLIEVMLGLTLLGIMMVLLFSAMSISARSWEAGEKKIVQVSEAASVYRFFQRYLSTARPLWNDFDDPDHRFYAFQGDTQSLQFVSSFPASANRPGLQSFTVSWVTDGDDDVLKVTLTPFFPSDQRDEWQLEEVVLLRKVSDFRLYYFGFDAVSGVSRWQDQWLNRDSLPRLVKISISQEDGILRPAMTIALKLTGATATEQNSEQDMRQNFQNPFQGVLN